MMGVLGWALLLFGCAAQDDDSGDTGGESDTDDLSDTSVDSDVSGDTDTSDTSDTSDPGPCPAWADFPADGVALPGDSPEGLVFGADCALYVVEADSVWRIAPDSDFVPTLFVNEPTFTRLQGLTFGPDGHLYIASRDADAIGRFDAGTGALLDVFATGGFVEPNTPRFAADGSLYVTSRSTGELVRFDTSGALIGAVVSQPSRGSPEDFAFTNDGRVIIGWRTSSAVYAYDLSTGEEGALVLGSPQMDSPEGIHFDAAGDLWLASRDNGTVYRLLGGDFSIAETVLMPAPGEPVGIDIGPDGRVYVGLRGLGRVWVLP